MFRALFLTTALAAFALPAAAQDVAPATPLNPASEPAEGDAATETAAVDAAPRVGIRPDIAEVTYTTPEGEAVTVSRDQTPGAKLEGDWALVGHDCPPFCIQPMEPAPGVVTIGELELLEMMQAGETTLVDGRTPDWYTGGTIPGAINIPYTQAIERLAELGCEPDFDGKFDCAGARDVILFCNGIWCGQSPTAIRAMLDAGYPAERIHYYRGGMLAWRLLGLTVAGGTQPAAVDPIAAQDVTPEEAAEPAAGQASAAADGLPQNAGQDVPDGVTTAAENPVVDGTTQEAAEEDAPTGATAGAGN